MPSIIEAVFCSNSLRTHGDYVPVPLPVPCEVQLVVHMDSVLQVGVRNSPRTSRNLSRRGGCGDWGPDAGPA